MAKRKNKAGKKGGTGCAGLLILLVMAAMFGGAGRQGSGTTSTTAPRATSTTRAQALVSQPVSQNSQEYTATGNANVRSCPKTTCDIVRGVSLGERITKIGETRGDSVNGSSLWYEVELTSGTIGFIHSGLARAGTPRPASVDAQPQATTAGSNTQPEAPSAQATQPAASNSQRPANCPTARAMGLTAQQAAQWPHLDRDNDRSACYED